MTQDDSLYHTGDILIVDDEVPNLQLLTQLLSAVGYQIRPAREPQLAIDSARAQPPDLILLDVWMPEMDGFEVSRRLKQDDRTRDVPIIFVSALQDVKDRVRGFELGGVDFISKPFQETEILARVRTHLALHKMTVDLEDLVAQRTAELTAANQALETEIDERIRAEAALKESRRFIDQLVETANVMIVGLDAEGCVTLANPAVELLTGYAPSELQGRNWIDHLVPEDRRAEVYQEHSRVVVGGTPKQFENPIRTRSGEESIISWSNSVLEEAGRVVGTLSFGIDVTEQRQKEKRIQEYQDRLKALASDLTITEERERRRIAEELHDGPLQALAFARMRLANAKRQGGASEQARALDEVSEILRQSALDTSQVVSDLSSPAMKELGLIAAISDWADEQIRSRFGIETKVVSYLETAEDQQLDELTRTILFRNVRELLANVVKHSKASSVRVLLERVGDKLALTVRDDGEGCDPALVFDGTSSDGGFGLFSIRERMADLGGALEIETGPGQGFTATLFIPSPRDCPPEHG